MRTDEKKLMKDFLAQIYGRLFRLAKRGDKKLAIGDDLKLYCSLSIRGPGRIYIGRGCTVRGTPGANIKSVTLYTHSQDAIIRIGENVNLIAARISSKFKIQVGDNVVIEDASILDTDFHTLDISRRTPPDETEENCGVVIGDDVLIGSRSIIGKGVSIGRGSLVYPGAVLQKSFPEYSQILGNPAKLFGKTETLGRR